MAVMLSVLQKNTGVNNKNYKRVQQHKSCKPKDVWRNLLKADFQVGVVTYLVRQGGTRVSEVRGV